MHRRGYDLMNDSTSPRPAPDYPPCRSCGRTVYFYMGDDMCLDCKDMGMEHPEKLIEAMLKFKREHPERFEK